ncbi:conserved exported protein of unknown function [Hyphomicrobium sp. MC1]|nr:conserved exported protein of unknown function [Hyphomicrobium sp. MC1]
MQRIFRLGAMLLAGLAAPVFVVASTHGASAHSGTAEEQSACTPDVLSLCFWQIPNEDKIVACLNKNINRLSPECRKVIAGDDDDKKSSKRSKK